MALASLDIPAAIPVFLEVAEFSECDLRRSIVSETEIGRRIYAQMFIICVTIGLTLASDWEVKLH